MTERKSKTHVDFVVSDILKTGKAVRDAVKAGKIVGEPTTILGIEHYPVLDYVVRLELLPEVRELPDLPPIGSRLAIQRPAFKFPPGEEDVIVMSVWKDLEDNDVNITIECKRPLAEGSERLPGFLFRWDRFKNLEEIRLCEACLAQKAHAH